METSSPADALSQAMAVAGKDDLVLATGSLFLAAEVREAVFGHSAGAVSRFVALSLTLSQGEKELGASHSEGPRWMASRACIVWKQGFSRSGCARK